MQSLRELKQLEKTRAFLKQSWQFIIKYNVGTILVWIFIIGINVFYISSIVSGNASQKDNGDIVIEKSFDKEINESDCNVLGVDVAGYITSNGINESTDFLSSDGDTAYSNEIKYQLDTANKDDNIKAVLLSVNSYGGDPGSAQEIIYAILNLNKPIISVIRSAGTSAGYWIAAVTNKIFAYETADIGSIGVTMSHLDETAVNTREGKYFVSLSVGKFKDMSNPDKSITAEERALMMRDVNDVYNIFVRQVSTFRGIPIEKVKDIADGSSMIASRAKEKGLIDEIGSSYDAESYLSKVIGEKVKLCEFDE